MRTAGRRKSVWIALAILSLVVPALALLTNDRSRSGAAIKVQPLNLPIEFSFGFNGEISVAYQLGTPPNPLGRISLEVPLWSGREQDRERILRTDTFLVLEHDANGVRVRDRFQLDGQGAIAACLNGQFYTEYHNNEVVLAAVGAVSRVLLVEPGGSAGRCAEPSPETAAPSPQAAVTIAPTVQPNQPTVTIFATRGPAVAGPDQRRPAAPPRTVAVPTSAASTAPAVTRHGPPVYVYPTDGQTLGYEGSYLFKVTAVPGASGYLYGFFQSGQPVWENYSYEGRLSGTEYAIDAGSTAHSRFHTGLVDVWVRALVGGQWTDTRIITIRLT